MDPQKTLGVLQEDHSPFLRGGVLLSGVELTALEVHRDARGSFSEVFREDWGLCIDPSQWSLVRSEPGTLRGMHLHRRHDEYFLVLEGRASVGLKDLRPNSPTVLEWALYEFAAHTPAGLSFPRGILHGWYFHEPSIHLQAVSETYGEYGHDDNLGCHWSDPDLGIPWPTRPTLVAPRADRFPTLAKLMEQTRQLSAPGEPWHPGSD